MEAVRDSLRDEALRRAVVRAVRAEDLISEAQCVQVRGAGQGCCCGQACWALLCLLFLLCRCGMHLLVCRPAG